MLVFGFDREVAKWAGDRVGISDFGPSAAIGVAHNGEIVAAAVYSNYLHPNIHVTFVTSSPRWASPGAIRAILKYPFTQLGCKRVTAITEAKNQPARAFLCRLGFKQEGIHPDSFPEDDGISYGLLARDAARWITERAANAVSIS
jgi:RimJ/RimL family protein N-acetyltransferase